MFGNSNLSTKQASTEHEQFVAKLNAVNEKTTFTIGDLELVAYPGVFSPIQSNDTAWFAEQLPQLCKDKDVLEIGSGTGAIAITVAKEGAKSVASTDINPHAIANIKENQEKNQTQFPVYEGSLFEPLPKDQKFDVIFWNHPFQKSEVEAQNTIEASMIDYKYQYLRAYIQNGFSYLAENGKLFLGTGNMEEYLQDIQQLADELGVKLKLVSKTKILSFKGGTTEMELGLYQIEKN